MSQTPPPTTLSGIEPRRLAWRLLAAAAAVVAFGILFIAGLELILRLFPTLLGPRLGNYTYTKYGTFPGAIYVNDRSIRAYFMRPNFSTRAYWNGYFWRHQTDRWGFRNPPSWEQKSLLLLGDSLIYGHGVDVEQTVTYALRIHHGRWAYSMARQGDCLFQEYVLLRLYAEQFHPRAVVLFPFVNDIDDLFVYRQPEEIVDPPELARYDYARIRERIPTLAERQSYSLPEQLERSYAVRLLEGMYAELGKTRLLPAAQAAAAEVQPRYVQRVLDDTPLALAGTYYRTILGDLAQRAKAGGWRLFVVHLDSHEGVEPSGIEARERFNGLLEEICQTSGIPFLTTTEAFAGCTRCFLPNDGHLSPAGHERLAEVVDRWLLDQGLPRDEQPAATTIAPIEERR